MPGAIEVASLARDEVVCNLDDADAIPRQAPGMPRTGGAEQFKTDVIRKKQAAGEGQAGFHRYGEDPDVPSRSGSTT